MGFRNGRPGSQSPKTFRRKLHSKRLVKSRQYDPGVRNRGRKRGNL